jgi:glycosyltransferase involved in cell wall biosynthesis
MPAAQTPFIRRNATMPSDITVVVPAYNAGRHIDATLQSILKQSLPPASIIVIDDCSTDDTVRRVKKYGAPVRLITCDRNSGGASRPRNIGIAAARTEHVAPFDADDLMRPDKLSWQMRAAESCSGAGIIFSDMNFFGDPGLKIPSQTHCALRTAFKKHLYPVAENIGLLSPPQCLRALLRENFIGGSALLLRREAWLACGGYDETLPGAEDYDFTLRLAERFTFAYIDMPLHSYRRMPGSISANQIKMNECLARVLQRYLKTSQPPQTRRALLNQLAETERDLACHYSAQFKISQAWSHLRAAARYGGWDRRLLHPLRHVLSCGLNSFFALRKIPPVARACAMTKL